MHTEFKNMGNTLIHGHQSDIFSCGIAALNSILHALFGDEVFNNSCKFAERLRLFEVATAMYNNKSQVCCQLII